MRNFLVTLVVLVATLAIGSQAINSPHHTHFPRATHQRHAQAKNHEQLNVDPLARFARGSRAKNSGKGKGAGKHNGNHVKKVVLANSTVDVPEVADIAPVVDLAEASAPAPAPASYFMAVADAPAPAPEPVVDVDAESKLLSGVSSTKAFYGQEDVSATEDTDAVIADAPASDDEVIADAPASDVDEIADAPASDDSISDLFADDDADADDDELSAQNDDERDEVTISYVMLGLLITAGLLAGLCVGCVFQKIRNKTPPALQAANRAYNLMDDDEASDSER